MQVQRLISLWQQASSNGSVASAYRSLFQGPRAAFIATTIVLGVILLTGSVYQPTAYTLFLGAIILSAYQGGVYPGVLAVVLSAFYLACLYIIPVKDAAVTAFSVIDATASVILLSLAGLLACFLANECRTGARQLDEHLRSLDHTKEGLIVLDEMLRVKHINRAAQTITGWSADEARTRPLEGVAGLTETQGGQPVRLPWATLLQNGSGNASGSAVLVTRDGAERYVDYWIEVIANADNGKDACFFFHDVSERRQIEEQGRRVLEQHQQAADNLPVPFVFLDQNSQCTLVNRPWQELVGINPDERGAATLAARLAPADAQFAANWTKSLRERGKYVSDCQIRTGPNLRQFRFESIPIRSERGDSIGHVCMLFDTTQARQTEAELARKQQELQGLQNLVHQTETEANEHAVALEKAQETLQQELARERKRFADLQSSLGNEQGRLSELQQELTRERRRFADLQAASAGDQERAEELQRDLAREQEKSAELRHELARERDLLAALREQAAEHEGVSGRLEKLTVELQNAKVALGNATQLYQLLQSSAPTGVIRWEGKQPPSIDATARAILELSGADSAGRWSEQLRMLHADGETPLDEKATPFALAEQRKAFHAVECCVQTRSGATRTLLSTAGPVGDGKKSGFVLLLRDVTEQRRLGGDLARVSAQHDASLRMLKDRIAELERQAGEHGWRRSELEKQITEFEQLVTDLDRQITELKEKLAAEQREKLALRERAFEPALPERDDVFADHPIIDRALAFAGCVAEQVRELSQQLHDQSERGPAEEFRKHCQVRMLQLNVLADSLRAAVRAPEKSLQGRQTVDITKTVNHVVTTWRRLMHANSRQLVVSLPAGPNWVVGSSDLLCLAVEILVDIACHNSEAGAYIDLSLAMIDGKATLAITDKGRGFTSAEIGYLRGERLALSHTGLEALRTGIAFVEALAEVHGGALLVDSDGRGKGCSFCLSLPRQASDATATLRTTEAVA